MIKYEHYPDDESGDIEFETFENGQSDTEKSHKINWSPHGFGEILPYQTHGKKPQSLGSIDSSSLSYHSEFTNRMNTTTQYELSIRWSTGRYTESWSGKDDKGKPFYDHSSGVCVKLNSDYSQPASQPVPATQVATGGNQATVQRHRAGHQPAGRGL
jgi:hypothetical protein